MIAAIYSIQYTPPLVNFPIPQPPLPHYKYSPPLQLPSTSQPIHLHIPSTNTSHLLPRSHAEYWLGRIQALPRSHTLSKQCTPTPGPGQNPTYRRKWCPGGLAPSHASWLMLVSNPGSRLVRDALWPRLGQFGVVVSLCLRESIIRCQEA